MAQKILNLMKINEIKNIIKLNTFKRVYLIIFFYIKNLILKFARDHIWTLSSAISFNIILGLIPFLLIILTVLGFYLDSGNVLDQIKAQLSIVLPLPDEYKIKLLMSFYEKATELIKNTYITGSIGVISLFWTMSGLFGSIRDVMNRIYDYDEERGFFYGKLKDFILVLAVILVFLLSISISTISQIIKINREYFIAKAFDYNIINTIYDSLFPFILSVILTAILFYILFHYVPNFIIPRKALLFIVSHATIQFEIFKFLFFQYILRFSTYDKFYGAFAAIVLSLIWIYFVSLVYCTSAALGKIYLRHHHLKIKSKINGTTKTI